MGRAQICCDKAIVKKGHWSPEEDKQLKEYIEKHGNGGNWISLPRKAGLKRCGKSCRLRWLNYLRPDIKHGSFSDTEDMIITNLYATIGSRWSIIASHLPGRTDNEIKNYWNTNLKKKFSGILTTPPKRIMQQQQQQQQDYTLTPSLDALNHLILSIPGIENLPNAACLLSLLTSTASGSGSAGTGTGTVGSPQLLQCAEEETSNFSNFGASSNLRCLSTHSDGSVDQSLGIVGEAWGGASSLLGQSKLDHKCELMPVVAAAAGSIDLCFDGYGGAREVDQVSMYYY